MESLVSLIATALWITLSGSSFSSEESTTPLKQESKKTAVHIFDDYLCEHCEIFSKNEFVTLRFSEEAQEKKIKFIWHFYEINEASRPLAIATYCAFEQSDQGGWDMHDALFNTPTKERTLQKTKSIAKHYNLDAEVWNTCLSAPETTEKIQKDEDLAQEWNITATPTTRIGGKNLPGRVPLENLIWEMKRMLSEKEHL